METASASRARAYAESTSSIWLEYLFSFQLATSNEANTRALLASIKDPHLDLLKRAVRRKLPDLPEAVFEQRWQFFRTEAFAGQWVRSKVLRIIEQGDWKWSPMIERDYLLRYLDYVIGGLTATR